MKKSVTMEEAFAITIELFKAEKLRSDKLVQALEWVALHDANPWEYKNFAKIKLKEFKDSK